MFPEQDSESERLGALSLPDIFPLSLPSIISSPHATKKKKNLRTTIYLFVSTGIYIYLGIPMGRGYTLMLSPKSKNKQKTKNTTICQRGSGLLLGSRVIPLANPSGKAAPFRSIPERLTGESRWTLGRGVRASCPGEWGLACAGLRDPVGWDSA